MAKIYRVIQIKFELENVHIMTDLPTKRITVANISKSFYLQDGGKNQLA